MENILVMNYSRILVRIVINLFIKHTSIVLVIFIEKNLKHF